LPADFGEGGNAGSPNNGAGGFGSGGAGAPGITDNGGFAGGDGSATAGGGGAGLGGAIFNQGGTVTIVNSTFAYNTAKGGIGGDLDNKSTTQGNADHGSALGAAVFNLSGHVTVVGSTFSRNTVRAEGATEAAGAFYSTAVPLSGKSDDSAEATLVNSLFANTIGGPDVANRNLTGAARLDASGRNLILRSSVRGGGTDLSNVKSADPGLGVLRDNGGWTQTMAPAVGSPVINAGLATTDVIALPGTDQRGGVRDSRPDLGAFEVVSALVPVGVPTTLFPAGTIASAETAFVKATYQSVLQRAGTALEVGHFTEALQTGTRTRADVVLILWHSQEHRGEQVDQYFGSFFGRSPTATERTFWMNVFLNGASEGTIIRRLLSEVSEANALSDAGLAQLAFTGLAGRRPTSDELTRFTNQLAGGIRRADFIAGLLKEPEVVRLVVGGYYRVYLGRAATGAELTSAMTAIGASSDTFGDIGMKLLASEEFWAKARAAAG